MTDAGGENTTGSSLVNQVADNTILGNPSLEGTLDILTDVTWEAPSASITKTSTGATLEFAQPGEHTVQATLANNWGSHNVSSPVVVITGTGIEEDGVVEDITTYPNPFVDGVFMLFVTQGNYSVDIYSLDGVLIESTQLDVTANERVYISLNATSGTYLMRVNEGAKCVKTFKLFKK